MQVCFRQGAIEARGHCAYTARTRRVTAYASCPDPIQGKVASSGSTSITTLNSIGGAKLLAVYPSCETWQIHCCRLLNKLLIAPAWTLRACSHLSRVQRRLRKGG